MDPPRPGILLMALGGCIFAASLLMVVLVVMEWLPDAWFDTASLAFTVGLPLGFVVAFSGWLKETIRNREQPPGSD